MTATLLDDRAPEVDPVAPGAGPTDAPAPAPRHARDPHADDRQPAARDGARPRSRRLQALSLVVVALAGAAVLVGLAAGWRLHSMITPSMGRTAPVGSIVVTSPVRIEQVHLGEIIAFHPPGRPSTTFVHRVVGIGEHGGRRTLRTRGDINGSVDGWVLTGRDLTGRERVIVPDLAFLLQMLPLLLLGTLLILLITGTARPARRGPLRLGLFSLLCSFLIYHFQPLTHVELISQTISHNHGRATIVTTGALPVRASAVGGTHADITPGQVGVVTRDHLPPSGHFAITTATHLTGWWWLLVLLWLVPIAASLRYTRRRPPPAASADDPVNAPGRHRAAEPDEPVAVSPAQSPTGVRARLAPS